MHEYDFLYKKKLACSMAEVSKVDLLKLTCKQVRNISGTSLASAEDEEILL